MHLYTGSALIVFVEPSLVSRPSYPREGLVLTAWRMCQYSSNYEESSYVCGMLLGRYLPCFLLLEN